VNDNNGEDDIGGGSKGNDGDGTLLVHTV